MCGIWCLARPGSINIMQEKAEKIINDTFTSRGPEGSRLIDY